MSELLQILDTVNIGLLVLDRDLKVTYWNRWMEAHSGIASDRIIGSRLFEFFPSLENPRFLRNCKSVLAFGNFSFFSQKLHGFLFPFPPDTSFQSRFDHMQQSCTMGPLRNAENHIIGLYLTVQDVTELASYEHRLIEMNMKDGLTGVYNRRCFEQRLTEEFERAKRYSSKFSIIMFDIDFFKSVNDNYGHQCGDAVLKSVSGRIASMIRKTDFVARYGGEEFCCLLPETDLSSALILAERFRETVAALDSVFQNQVVKVSISLGVAEMKKEYLYPEAIVEKADEALYAAKRSGRNRVVGA
jgi:diguanylate cyclase (GGDEF)-like protein